ncbi:hypothetical protein GD1_121 [Paraglaciecola Antarctic GD virus 1]|nr:hypothetical protein GD1_121 [Paraglaciecola Antarctic GD virus 1]
MVLCKETMKRANKYYQNPTIVNLENLIIVYNMLSWKVADMHDKAIQKLIPSWAK